MVAWTSELARVTLFPKGPVGLSPGTWKAVLGAEPDSTTRHRTLLVEAGPVDDLIFVAQRSSDRIDLLLSSRPEIVPLAGHPTEKLQVSIPLPRLLSEHVKRIGAWLSLGTEGPFKRIALGGVGHFPVASISEGNTTLKDRFLPFLDIGDAADLFYQVNRRRPSAKVQGVSLNRLSKWSVITGQSVFLPLGISAEIATLEREPPQHMVRVEVDLSTAPEESRTFAGAEATVVLDEFLALGCEILEKGDVP